MVNTLSQVHHDVQQTVFVALLISKSLCKQTIVRGESEYAAMFYNSTSQWGSLTKILHQNSLVVFLLQGRDAVVHHQLGFFGEIYSHL